MQITEASVVLVTPKAGLIAFASIVLDDCFLISGIAVHAKRDGTGYRLTYPTRKTESQTFNICHPLNGTTSRAIEQAVFDQLKTVLSENCSNARYHRHQSAAG